MTKLEELKAAHDAAYADWYAADAARDDANAAEAAAWDAAYSAEVAYEAELKKQEEKQNALALSTDETHRT